MENNKVSGIKKEHAGLDMITEKNYSAVCSNQVRYELGEKNPVMVYDVC